MAYDRTNTGTLGKNKRKEKDTHPSHTGQINIDGREYWLSAWVKEHNGEKFFSLSAKPKEERKQEPKAFHDGLDDSDLDAPFDLHQHHRPAPELNRGDADNPVVGIGRLDPV